MYNNNSNNGPGGFPFAGGNNNNNSSYPAEPGFFSPNSQGFNPQHQQPFQQSQGYYPDGNAYSTGPPPPQYQPNFQQGTPYPPVEQSFQGYNNTNNPYTSQTLTSPQPDTSEDDYLLKGLELNENMTLNEMVLTICGSSVNMDYANVANAANASRSISGFDSKSLEANYSEFSGIIGGGTDERGLFKFNKSNNGGVKNKSPLSHQLIAGAAAYAGMKWWNNKQKKSGKHVSHGSLKQMSVAVAVAMAIKWWEKSGGVQSGISRDAVAHEAARNACLAYDDNQSSGQYNYNYDYRQGESTSFDGFNPNASNQSSNQYNQGNYGGYSGY